MTVHGGRHDLVAVTTTYGKTIALDAGTGHKLWEFDPAGVNGTPGNPQVTTAGPVADPNRRYLYSASPNGVIRQAFARHRPAGCGPGRSRSILATRRSRPR